MVFVAGCGAPHYRRSADKEVYQIIQQYEQRVFGRTNGFTIDTEYSGRAPQAVSPAEILEGRTATNRVTLNLEQALDLAVRRSREYQTQKERLYLTALSLTGARYDFSPQFIAKSQAQVTGSYREDLWPEIVDGRTNYVRKVTRTDTGSVRSQVGVSYLLRTGGRLSLTLANDLVRYFTGYTVRSDEDNSGRNTAINTLSVDLVQPILRGFGRNDPTVENLTQKERDVVYAIRTYSLYQQQFALDTVQDYFALLTLKDIVRNNYRNYTNRVETTRYLAAREDRQTRPEVDQSQTAELGAKISYINSVASYLTSLDAFKKRLNLPLTAELYLDDRDLKELMDGGLLPADIDRNAAFRIAVGRHMEILNAIDAFEDTKRKVRIAADQLKADLNLFANATVVSQGEDDYVDFDLNKVRYTAGLQLDLPVDRLRERNTYRSALVSFESEVRALSLTLDNHKDRIDRGLRTVEEQRLNHLNRQISLEVARRWVEASELRLRAGRVGIREVRDAQDALISAENQLAATIASYLQNRLQLLLDIGVLDSSASKFWLKDQLQEYLTAEARGFSPLRMPDDHVLPPERFFEPTP